MKGTEHWVDGVRVTVTPSRDGTSMVNYGKGKGVTKGKAFRLDQREGADDLAAQVRMRPDFAVIQEALGEAVGASGRQQVGGVVHRATLAAELPEDDEVVETSSMFGDVDAILMDVQSAVASPRKRRRVVRFDPAAEGVLSAYGQQMLQGRGNGARRASAGDGAAECTRAVCIRARCERDRLKRKREATQQELRRLEQELDGATDGLQPVEALVVRHLQQGLIELLDDDASPSEDREAEGAEVGRGDEVQESNEERTAEEDVEGEPAAARDADEVVAAYIPAAHSDGSLGSLALRGEELHWVVHGASTRLSPSTRIALMSEVAGVSTKAAPRANPFTPPSTHLIVRKRIGNRTTAEEVFDLRCLSGSALADAEAFVLLVNQTLDDRRDENTHQGVIFGVTSEPAATTHRSASVSQKNRPQTARVRAGQELREELLKVARLRHDHKIRDSDDLLSKLNVVPSDAGAATRENALAKQRVRELRDCLFSIVGFSLTKRVIDRFLTMPEIRLLLPEGMQQQRQARVDAETSRILLEAAKAFLTKIFKARSAGRRRPTDKGGGRRNDDDRNAFAATLAALLPASLFEDRRARSAMRILGISYRQAKLGSRVRGELEDRGHGWKRIQTAQHSDKVDYSIVSEFWHSELASHPDNQNKAKVRVELGIDPKTGERLYDMHEQRAQCGTARVLFAVFHASQFAARLREATRTRIRRNGVKLGWRQFLDAKCDCIKERKPSECDCQTCTYVTENLQIWHRRRRGFFQEGRETCGCQYHRGGHLELRAELACEAEEAAWAAAGAAAAECSEDESLTALEASKYAREAERAVVLRDTYESMSRDVESLHRALLPCGRVSLPKYSVTGVATFATYQRDCVYNNCRKRVFNPSEACGWDRQFPVTCPLDRSEAPFSWRVWEQRACGKNDEGQPTYTPEFAWKHGTRGEFVKEFTAGVKDWLPHVWRDVMMKQGLRVYEDRKSGRHLDEARSTAARLILKRDALKLLVADQHEPSPVLTALARVAAADAAASARDADMAADVHAAAARSATVQSDYASQIQTKRSHTATCARPERHNCLVCVVGYKPYRQERVLRGSGKRKARGHRGYRSPELEQYRQHIDVFYAFHDASYKPSARSFNLAREDIDHFLKHGTFIHGEWYTGGQRCAGGDHSQPLPEGFSERPQMPADFPEYAVAIEPTDGAPTQFANATNHHQTAVWRSKTGIIRRHAKHVEHHGKSSCDGYANVPTHGIHDAVWTGNVIDPTTRKVVLYLAEHKQHPMIPKHLKPGWEAADRYFFGYMPPAKFTKHAVPDAESGREWKSKSDQDMVGMSTDTTLAQKEGPLRAGRLFCSCGPCIILKFDDCEIATLHRFPMSASRPSYTPPRERQVTHENTHHPHAS